MLTDKLEQLLQKYSGMVDTICRGILYGFPCDADEAKADTFLKLWRSKSLPTDDTHLRNYVIRTARSCAIDKYRRIVRNGVLLPFDERDDIAFAVELEDNLERQELIDLIQALPPPDGELFLRRYLYCEPATLLAQYFHMSENTVRTKLHRAKKKLQKQLNREGML